TVKNRSTFRGAWERGDGVALLSLYLARLLSVTPVVRLRVSLNDGSGCGFWP
ncbi:ORFS357C, partial [Human betaherpesvirus 5]